MQCESSSSPSKLSNYLYVIILGQLINGYAGSALFSLGITYIDQSVPAKVAPIYLSESQSVLRVRNTSDPWKNCQ